MNENLDERARVADMLINGPLWGRRGQVEAAICLYGIGVVSRGKALQLVQAAVEEDYQEYAHAAWEKLNWGGGPANDEIARLRAGLERAVFVLSNPSRAEVDRDAWECLQQTLRGHDYREES